MRYILKYWWNTKQAYFGHLRDLIEEEEDFVKFKVSKHRKIKIYHSMKQVQRMNSVVLQCTGK